MTITNNQPPKNLDDDLVRVGVNSETPEHLRLLLRQIDSIHAASDLIVIGFRTHEIAKSFVEAYAFKAYLDDQEFIPTSIVSEKLFGHFGNKSRTVWLYSPKLSSGSKLTVMFGKIGEKQVAVKEVQIP